MLKATSETLSQRKTSLLNILVVGTTEMTGGTLVELMMYQNLIDYTRTGLCCWGLSDCEELAVITHRRDGVGFSEVIVLFSFTIQYLTLYIYFYLIE